MPSRFGLQPARAALIAQRWSIPAAAREIDVPTVHLGKAVHGHTVPAPGVRARLPKLLGVPIEDLFTAEALSHTYDTTRGPKARERRQQSWAVSS